MTVRPDWRVVRRGLRLLVRPPVPNRLDGATRGWSVDSRPRCWSRVFGRMRDADRLARSPLRWPERLRQPMATARARGLAAALKVSMSVYLFH